jgi:UDP-glucose 4-epimerase
VRHHPGELGTGGHAVHVAAQAGRRVLVTGAGGNLGRAVVPALVEAGHCPVLFDFRPITTEQEFVEGDVRDAAAVARAMDGVDAVVHAAALHGIHLQTWSAEDFWSINVTGTFNVYQAARDAGVRQVVLGSSMVVYGDIGGGDEAWEAVTEQSPLRPTNLYGLTKVLSEDIARYCATAGVISTVALRLGMFVPETFERYGFRLLFGGVDDRDVAHAVLRALEHRPQDGFAAFDIMADSGLVPDELPRLDTELAAVLDEHWPGATSLVQDRGLDLASLIWGRRVYPVQHARAVLGYEPRYDFAAFLDALRRDDPSHYPCAQEPWWGVERPDRS